MTSAPHGASAESPEHPLERLIFFSDAVFAIAITLLIIEIHVPHLPYGSPTHAYLVALGELWPSLFGFFVSFWVIGAFWAGHHRAFALAAHHSEALVGANLAMLCAVVFMPFATAFMAGNPGALVPSVVYSVTLMITGLLNSRLVRMATSPPVVAANAPAERIAYIQARGAAVVLGAACALIIAFIDARFSQIGLATIPIWQRLLKARATRRIAKAE